MRRALIVLFGLLLLTACQEVAFIERVVLVNDTDYPVNVDVRGDEGGWLGLTTVSPHETREVGEVIDQGASWTFRFSYGSHQPVDVTVSREELIESRWQVEVPTELEDLLKAEGVPPTS